ncbi:LysR family transcriptional regulator [Xanthobacter tagetidis]|uniref:LysR family transcriptional regulator n=1 Tax=Xanthobacter tagetidis TaxID=60216 RepID=A0A3L7A7V6_9HYPH|nr:LysR family transcriptional regulator [Xanthobacter tagetidis]MBB6307357.1 DNA-binding transcriptional LysR family regulator [Xanthobacter tagetidis]RLP75890.1 LysR family transcriptional regulator [Xanthobacter tagetidis]
MFNWNDLTYFLELARQSRLMPAARRLRVDHTTVSRRIAELEKDLSVKLFDRKPDGFVLTEQGHRLFAIAERIELEAGEIQESIRAAPSAPTGRVRVASMEGIGAFYLAERFAELAEKEPGIVVELVTERHLINLTKREADISISFVPLSGQRLVMRKVGQFRLALYAAPDYIRRRGLPQTVDDLPAHMFVDYVEDLVAIQPVHWLLDVLEPANVAFRSTSMHAQQNAIARGAGIGLLPLFSAKSNPRLIPVLADEVTVTRDIYVGVHEDLEFMGRVKMVLRHLTDVFKRDADYLTKL